MKKLKTNVLKSSPFRLTALATAFLAAGGILLAPASSRAQDVQDDAAFTCASAVNVLDCMNKTRAGTPQAADITATPINSQALGFTGPITTGIRYDNYLAWILDVGYAQEFYNAAAAFKLSAGLNERRANVTLGYAITPKQQIKLTYEYLAQNLPFDYASGKVNEWVNQNAFGGAYRYMLDYGIIRALEIYGTYTKANSKELSDVEMFTGDALTAINYRRIAGGTEKTAGTSVTLTPFKNTIVKLGAGYSTLNFDTKWGDDTTNAVIAYNAELSHLLTPTTLISTGIGNTASGRTHTARISQILPWSLEASLVGQYTATTSDIPSSTSVTAALSYPAPKTYTNMFAEGIGKLKDWVEKPVVYHTRVLAKAEELVIQVAITTNKIPTQTIYVNGTIQPISLHNYFTFNETSFNKVEYNVTEISPNTVTLKDLNLSIAPVDAFNANLVSTGPLPAAMPSGQYTLTIQASAYRDGKIVNKADNPLALTTGPAFTPDWNTQPKQATAGQDYLFPLNGAVKSNIDGDTLLTPYQANQAKWTCGWLAIDPDSNVLKSTQVPQGSDLPCEISLSLISKLSGQTQSLNDTITATTGPTFEPTWKTAGGPATAFMLDSENTAYYLTPNVESNMGVNDVLSFEKDPSNWGCTWMTFNKNGNNSYLSGAPATMEKCTIILQVTSQNAKSTQPLLASIDVQPKEFKAIWTTQPIAAKYGLPYTFDLEASVQSNISNDTLTFSKGANWGCAWLDINGYNLQSTPTRVPHSPEDKKCQITITVTSDKASENADLAPVDITIDPGFQPDWQPGAKPTQIPIDIQWTYPLNSSTIHNNISPNDTMTFGKGSIWTCSSPSWSQGLDINGNVLTGEATVIGSCSFTLKVTSATSGETVEMLPATSLDMINPEGAFDPYPGTFPGDAYFGKDYGHDPVVDLTQLPAFNSNIPGDTITYTPSTPWGCSWLTLVNNKLISSYPPKAPAGGPKAPGDNTTCTITVTLHSQKDPAHPVDKAITMNVLSNFDPQWSTRPPEEATYDLPYSYGLPGNIYNSKMRDEPLSYAANPNWTCTWMNLVNGNTMLNGTPLKVQGECIINIDVTGGITGETATLPAEFTVVNNGTFKPEWITPPPSNENYGDHYSFNMANPNKIKSSYTDDTINYDEITKGATWDCEWLKITDKTYLTGDVPSNKLQESCHFTVHVKSTDTGEEADIIPVITITYTTNPNAVVSWNSQACPVDNIEAYKTTTQPVDSCLQTTVNGKVMDDSYSSTAFGGTSLSNVQWVSSTDSLNITPNQDDMKLDPNTYITVNSLLNGKNNRVNIPIKIVPNSGYFKVIWTCPNQMVYGTGSTTDQGDTVQVIDDITKCAFPQTLEGFPLNGLTLTYEMTYAPDFVSRSGNTINSTANLKQVTNSQSDPYQLTFQVHSDAFAHDAYGYTALIVRGFQLLQSSTPINSGSFCGAYMNIPGAAPSKTYYLGYQTEGYSQYLWTCSGFFDQNTFPQNCQQVYYGTWIVTSNAQGNMSLYAEMQKFPPDYSCTPLTVYNPVFSPY